MYISDTEDDPSLTHEFTYDHVLAVSKEALSKVILRLVFKLMLSKMTSQVDGNKEKGFLGEKEKAIDIFSDPLSSDSSKMVR